MLNFKHSRDPGKKPRPSRGVAQKPAVVEKSQPSAGVVKLGQDNESEYHRLTMWALYRLNEPSFYDAWPEQKDWLENSSIDAQIAKYSRFATSRHGPDLTRESALAFYNQDPKAATLWMWDCDNQIAQAAARADFSSSVARYWFCYSIFRRIGEIELKTRQNAGRRRLAGQLLARHLRAAAQLVASSPTSTVVGPLPSAPPLSPLPFDQVTEETLPSPSPQSYTMDAPLKEERATGTIARLMSRPSVDAAQDRPALVYEPVAFAEQKKPLGADQWDLTVDHYAHEATPTQKLLLKTAIMQFSRLFHSLPRIDVMMRMPDEQNDETKPIIGFCFVADFVLGVNSKKLRGVQRGELGWLTEYGKAIRQSFLSNSTKSQILTTYQKYADVEDRSDPMLRLMDGLYLLFVADAFETFYKAIREVLYHDAKQAKKNKDDFLITDTFPRILLPPGVSNRGYFSNKAASSGGNEQPLRAFVINSKKLKPNKGVSFGSNGKRVLRKGMC